jgi:glyoxylase-like metal-dependent hydrolase (beta-lactamase superfamily II)
MGWSTSVVAPPDGDMGQYIASLEKLALRGDDIFYPTHGLPIADPKARLQTLLAHRRMREEQILDALAEGPRSVDQLTARIYPGIGERLARAAAEQVRAHLLWLAEKEVVARDGALWSLRSGIR